MGRTKMVDGYFAIVVRVPVAGLMTLWAIYALASFGLFLYHRLVAA